jgi:hypothetical protein
MTLAVDQTHQRRWSRRSEVVTPSGVRATVRPLGAAGVGLLGALVGAWGAISVFVGPDFGYRPTTAGAWQWTTNNWLLHLIPGAVAVAAGLMIMSLSPGRRAGAGTGGALGLAALLLVAAGAWFVIGPALWPTFESTAPFATATTSGTSFVNQLGASLGPGLLLAMLGGMALKAGIARPAVAVGEAAPETASGREPVEAVDRRHMEPTNANGVDRRDTAPTTTEPAVSESRRVEDTGGSPAPQATA